jgi:hypothetical protein
MDIHVCKICIKEYSSYKSLWNHNNKYHTSSNSKLPQITPPNTSNSLNTLSTQNTMKHCIYCKKHYTRKDNLTRHYKICKKNTTVQVSNEILEENFLLKEELSNMSKTIEELKIQMTNILNKQCKEHPKTLIKINKQLNLNNSIVNNTTNSNNTINIIQLGKEELDTVLSNKEQINILNKNHNSLEYMIEYIHFNEKYPQFKNIMITNQQSNIAYKYDNIQNKFIATNKNELVDELISCRTADLEEFLDNNINRLEQKTVNNIKEFINKITYDDSYDELKKTQVKLLIYNNRSKITKEIYQDLEVII